MSSIEGIQWVRECSEVEKGFEWIGRMEILLVCYNVSVASSEPLTQQQVTQALTHLYRKAPNLRVCFGDNKGTRWFREMDPPHIDFKIVNEGSVEGVVQELHTFQYNSTAGPLWCVRLFPLTEPPNTTSRFCSFRGELQADFPHCYHVLFGFHHSIGDGHSFKNVISSFMTILDDILSGNSIDDQQQIGKFELNEEFDRKILGYETEIESDPTLKQKYIDAARKGEPAELLLAKILPPPTGTDRKTLVISQAFDCELTGKLIKRSKAEGISVNSSFSAICNLAYADLLHENGVLQETYTISNVHLVNTRRYWNPSLAARNLGCYISLTRRQFFETHRDVDKEEFWKCASRVHQDLHHQLRGEDAVRGLTFIALSMKNNEPYNDRDLTYNTLGDLTSLFSGTRKVRVTQMVNTSSMHTTNMAWDHIVSTVGGYFTHSIKYNSGIVARDMVVRYMDLIYARLKEMTS